MFFFSNSFFRSGTFTLQWLRSSNNKDIRLIHVGLQEKKMKIVIYNEHIFYRINLCNVRHVEWFFLNWRETTTSKLSYPDEPTKKNNKKPKNLESQNYQIQNLLRGGYCETDTAAWKGQIKKILFVPMN